MFHVKLDGVYPEPLFRAWDTMIRPRLQRRTIALALGAIFACDVLASVSSLAADEFAVVTPGPFGADYIRDETGLIVGSITPGIGGGFYVRDRSGRIVGKLDGAGGVLLVPSD
jgi:hypothetical protein